MRAGSASYCYALGDSGARSLGIERIRRREPSAPFFAHTLAVAEVAVRLREAVRHEPDASLTFALIDAEPACWRSSLGLGGEVEHVKPDLYVELMVGMDELHWFVEVDRGTEHRPAIVRKLQAYERYYRSGREQLRTSIFPKVLWVVDAGQRTETRIEQLIGWIDQGKAITKQLFVVRSMDEATEELKGGEL